MNKMSILTILMRAFKPVSSGYIKECESILLKTSIRDKRQIILEEDSFRHLSRGSIVFIMDSKKLLMPAAVAVASMLLLSVVFSGISSMTPAFAVRQTEQTIGQHMVNDKELTIDSVTLNLKKRSSTEGTVTIKIVQDGQVLGSVDLSTDDMRTKYKSYTAEFTDPVAVDASNFDIVVHFLGEGKMSVQRQSDRLIGNAFVDDVQRLKSDLKLKINGEYPTKTAGISEPETPGPGDDSGTPDTGEKVKLKVDAVDQNSNKISGLWVAVLDDQGKLIASGYTEIDASFTLDAGKAYSVDMGDFFNDKTQTTYQFKGWLDSANDDNRRTATLTSDDTFNAEYTVTTGAVPPIPTPDDNNSPPPPPPSGGAGELAAFAYRIPSSFWGATFTSANAQMYFVIYNSTGGFVTGGFYDENGSTVKLNDGESYWIVPQDCHHCHGGTHDVAFNHWEDSSTERVRAVTTGLTVGAYYEYVPDTP